VLLLIAIAAAGTSACSSDAECAVYGPDQVCVVESQYYSACVDCTPSAFASSCKYYSSDFLSAAEAQCGAPGCDGRCPNGNSAECTNSTTGDTCVKTASGDQCISCADQATFDAWCTQSAPADDFVIAAQDACGLACTSRCPTHSDADCVSPAVCVVQDDGYFDQCVDCTPAAFEASCAFLSDQILPAAEAKCGEACNETAATAP